MKEFIASAVLVFVAIIIGVGIYNFPKGENPIFSKRGINGGEIVKRLVNQERSSYSYRYYIILDGQPGFQMEKSMWDNFTGNESFGYIPKKNSAWKSWSFQSSNSGYSEWIKPKKELTEELKKEIGSEWKWTDLEISEKKSH